MNLHAMKIVFLFMIYIRFESEFSNHFQINTSAFDMNEILTLHETLLYRKNNQISNTFHLTKNHTQTI